LKRKNLAPFSEDSDRVLTFYQNLLPENQTEKVSNFPKNIPKGLKAK
jgi:hypothetical protein